MAAIMLKFMLKSGQKQVGLVGLCGCKFVSQQVSEHAKPYSACCVGLSIGGGFSMRGQFVGGACGGLMMFYHRYIAR